MQLAWFIFEGYRSIILSFVAPGFPSFSKVEQVRELNPDFDRLSGLLALLLILSISGEELRMVRARPRH